MSSFMQYKNAAFEDIIFSINFICIMRSPFLLFVINVILFGLVRKNCQAFGFGLTPAPLNVVPLSAVAPSPFAFPSPFPAPFPFPAAPPVLVLAPSYAPAPFFPPAYPPYAAPPPYAPPPYAPAPYAPYSPHLGLASAILNLILAKKGKYLPPPPFPYPPPPPPSPPPPPPPPYPYPPQLPRALPNKHVLNVHITKDEDKKHHHWHEDKPKWD